MTSNFHFLLYIKQVLGLGQESVTYHYQPTDRVKDLIIAGCTLLSTSKNVKKGRKTDKFEQVSNNCDEGKRSVHS